MRSATGSATRTGIQGRLGCSPTTSAPLPNLLSTFSVVFSTKPMGVPRTVMPLAAKRRAQVPQHSMERCLTGSTPSFFLNQSKRTRTRSGWDTMHTNLFVWSHDVGNLLQCSLDSDGEQQGQGVSLIPTLSLCHCVPPVFVINHEQFDGATFDIFTNGATDLAFGICTNLVKMADLNMWSYAPIPSAFKMVAL